MALSLSPAWRDRLTSFLICFSLGNLCFLRRWYDLEHLRERAMDYYRAAPASPTLLSATVTGAFILALVLWGAWLLVQRSGNPIALRVAQCVFLLMLIYPLESVRRYWNGEAEHPDPASNIALLALEAVLGAGFLLALAGNLRIVRAARRVTMLLTLLAPALLLDFAMSGLGSAPAEAFEAKPPLPMLDSRPARRVIWVLFDELDQRMAFDLRRPKVDLPEVDRLRAESVVANHARQTAGWTTLAIPSLLSGRMYERAELVDATTLRLQPEGSGSQVNWRDESNVFKRARELGVNAELIGWHHPYCRVLGDSTTGCLAIPSGHPTAALLRETSVSDEGLARAIPFLFRLQLRVLSDMLHPDSRPDTETGREEYVQRRQQRQYFNIRDAVYKAAADPRLGLLFVHFPLPHPFGIYDRSRADFTLNPRLTYADNLALMDRTVGELRRVLEKAGMWESTSVLIISDHGYRPDLWHDRQGWTQEIKELTVNGQSETVPFILKVAGDDRGLVYDKPFSSVVCADMVLAILSGKVSTSTDAAAWLDRRAAPLN
jgi:Sulfatase